MLSVVLRFLKPIGLLVLAVALSVPLYLGATIAGALIPAAPSRLPQAVTGSQADGERIYLLTTLLHADFAIPVDDELRARFAFLGDAGVPLGSADLRYLVFGWGSRAFYINTPTLADISAATTLRAMTGDESVMHVLPARDVSVLPNATAIRLPDGGLERLLDFIEASFERGSDASQQGYGYGDVFYAARGGFNIFRPCNIWVASGLRRAGLATGAWTPTTHSLMLGLSLHASGALED